MNWLKSFNSKRTQICIVACAPSVIAIIQALASGQPIPMEHVYVVLGAVGIWSTSDSLRPTVKPATESDFDRIQRLLEDLQAKIDKSEVAK